MAGDRLSRGPSRSLWSISSYRSLKAQTRIRLPSRRRQLQVSWIDDHTVVPGSRLHAHEIVPYVLLDKVWVALQGSAPAASTCRRCNGRGSSRNHMTDHP